MRSLVIILATVLALAGGFGIYLLMQGPAPTDPERKPRTTQRVERPGKDSPGGGVIDASGVWIWRIDKNGRRTSRIKAEQYDPISADRVKVTRPVIEFYLSDGQVLRIAGKSGIVHVQSEPGRSGGKVAMGLNQTPHRGQLRDVTLSLFGSLDAASDPHGEPDLTLTMNNASFDNEALKIQTEEWVDPQTRKTLPGERVPIVGQGKEYDFEGQGLELRWNNRDHRLEFLKVFHGRRLVIKKPSKLMDGRMAISSTAEEPWSGPLLASADPKAVGEALRPAPTTAPRPSARPGRADEEDRSQIYRAVFNENVVVERGDQPVASANVMQVDFRPRTTASTQRADDDARASPPPDSPRTARPKSTKPSTKFATRPLQAATRPSASTRATAATSPATQAIEVPVVITWTGPLTVVPLDTHTDYRVDAGQAVVRLTGNPVTLHRPDGQATCGALTFRTADRWLEMEEAGMGVVRVTDAKGLDLRTPRLDFARDQLIAHAYGPTTAVAPLGAGQGAPGPARLDARWTDQCTIFFEEQAGDRLAARRAEMRGKVAVKHPQLLLDSDLLAMDFEPTTRPSGPSNEGADVGQMGLRGLDATNNVHCQMIDSSGARQTIDSAHLKLMTARDAKGAVYPRQVIADGNVHAVDPQRDLRAGYLSLMLRPATQPATAPTTAATGPATAPADAPRVELESLLAHDRVRVIRGDEGHATCDQLVIRVEDGRQNVKLLGSDALVVQKESTLTGPIIVFEPETQHAAVLGAGTLKTLHQPSATAPARPVEIKWKTNLSADGQANQVDCVGNVVAMVGSADGAAEIAKGERARILLADAPATRPATRPGTRPSTKAGTRPARPAELGMMGDKVARQIILFGRPDEQASVESSVLNTQGGILQGTLIRGAEVRYDLASRRLLVPCAGNLSMEDRRPRATTGPGTDVGDMRGQTAVVWEKQLDYDPSAAKATVEGNVRLNHLAEDPGGRSFELAGQRFVADLTGDAPTTRPADGQPLGGGRIKALRGEGQIVLKLADHWFEADSMEYDPAAHTLVVRGTDQRPARELEPAGPLKGTQRGTFTEARIDTRTLDVKFVNFQRTFRK
jgi:hypothetical protein